MIFLKFNNLLLIFLFLFIHIFLPLNANEKKFFLNEQNNSNVDKLKKDINFYEKEYSGNWIIEKSAKDAEEIKWVKEKSTKDAEEIKWIKEKISKDVEENKLILEKESFKNKTNKKIKDKNNFNKKVIIGSLNRSLVFDDEVIGPDVSWIIPPGFKWNKKYKFDLSARGHNTQIPEPSGKKNFFGWNNGDAVGLFSYQFLNKEKYSFGTNLGIRSIYEGGKVVGGNTSIGEGLSSGFRWDYALSENSGFAIGAEQLIHYDGLTDTGRNIYLTLSKAWWSTEYHGEGIFPLYVATAGLGTGRMAVGGVNGLCSNFFGGSGTEVKAQRRLCWAPVFSLASVWNKKFSTYLEYNSRFFLLGSSIAPIQKLPIRGNLALILSDHIDNYKIHNFSELNWVFNISVGF